MRFLFPLAVLAAACADEPVRSASPDSDAGSQASADPSARPYREVLDEMLEGAMRDFEDARRIQAFMPSKSLRDALFDVDAVREHFGIDAERNGFLRLHAQVQLPEEWYVYLEDGEMDSRGPAADCVIEVGNRADDHFDRLVALCDGTREARQREAVAELFGAGELAEATGSDSLTSRLDELAETRDDLPPELLEKIEARKLRSARYEPLEFEWGDRAFAAVRVLGDERLGNAVVVQKGRTVVQLEWRGAGIDDGDALLAFVGPHLERLTSMEPGDDWIEAWSNDVPVLYVPAGE